MNTSNSQVSQMMALEEAIDGSAAKPTVASAENAQGAIMTKVVQDKHLPDTGTILLEEKSTEIAHNVDKQKAALQFSKANAEGEAVPNTGEHKERENHEVEAANQKGQETLGDSKSAKENTEKGNDLVACRGAEETTATNNMKATGSGAEDTIDADVEVKDLKQHKIDKLVTSGDQEINKEKVHEASGPTAEVHVDLKRHAESQATQVKVAGQAVQESITSQTKETVQQKPERQYAWFTFYLSC